MGAERKATAQARTDTPVTRPALGAVAGAGPEADALELDRLIHERVRLGIVSALAVNGRLPFTDLRELLGTTDGNLSAHARRLEDAGYLWCHKSFDGRVPRTEYELTARGRQALRGYLDHMQAIVAATRVGWTEQNSGSIFFHGNSMTQSTRASGVGLHVGIIMDGNGRWAKARGRPREWGHRQGARTVRTVVEAAPEMGIRTLTLYAFSQDNWQRPSREVRALMGLFRRYLRSETPRLLENGVRLRVIGRRDRLAVDLVEAIDRAEAETAACARLDLRLAVDYSSRDAMVRAARAAAACDTLDRVDFEVHLARAIHAGEDALPEVDLLVRTGGEQRLSDFLLWECAYAELVFTPRMWPDFESRDLAAAIREFHGRHRRFGAVAAAG